MYLLLQGPQGQVLVLHDPIKQQGAEGPVLLFPLSWALSWPWWPLRSLSILICIFFCLNLSPTKVCTNIFPKLVPPNHFPHSFIVTFPPQIRMETCTAFILVANSFHFLFSKFDFNYLFPILFFSFQIEGWIIFYSFLIVNGVSGENL